MKLHNNELEPIAIIGIGCRFPGNVNSPEAFWQLLKNGVDAITEVPPERWNLRKFYDSNREKTGKIYNRLGGFIKDIDKFDAQFFGISPREAECIDPQHRLLLEVAWEALEDGGLVPENLAGSNSGVFIGISSHDYGDIQTSVSEHNLINAYVNLGGATSIVANRISYAFNFCGPSMAVDTACSSALVAVHLACRSLWTGECTLALAGGVNALIKPETTIGFSKASMLSPDGYCKSFDAEANGYVRGEGAGMVILKPISRALADGDPIYAVIRGSAVNSDGHTNGITVPNGLAQEAALQKALKQAGVLPKYVQYIEAHGTGTSVGDPIEANALGNVLGKERNSDSYCIIGSVKTNIGHLESAAGIAGLIKTALALKHRQIPPSLNFQTPNPKIPFEKLRLRVAQALEPWQEKGNRSRFAGVNSFGFGGTNAHIVLEGAETYLADDRPQKQVPSDNQALLLPLSARSSDALQEVAKITHEFLTAANRSSSVSLSDICYSASLRRGHHPHRLVLVGDSKEKLIENLEGFLAKEERLGMYHGQIQTQSPKVAFVFSGMGPQWWAMGRQLLEQELLFRTFIKHCDELLRQYADWSLWEELTASEERSRINETQIAQPAIFAVQVALAALWRSWGIEPEAIVGHSVGEVAAAHVAGVLNLEDAIQVIFHRSRLQSKTVGQGRMLAVGLSLEEAQAVIGKDSELVSIAAVNSPSSITLSGNSIALEKIAKSLELQEKFCRFLQVEVPYHSPLMEPLKAELIESLKTINPQSATIPLFSTVTGEQVLGTELDAAYWAQNMRKPVLFAAAVDRLMQTGYDLFLEISAHPVLANSISECLAQTGRSGTVLPSLRRKEPERVMMLGSLGKLYTLGYSVDWRRLYPEKGHFVRLPSYPWQRERYWHESEESQQARLGQPAHPLLGSQLPSVQPVWNGSIDKQQLSYLNDHRIQGVVVYPGAAYVEMALAAESEIFGSGTYVLEEIEFLQALFLPDNKAQTVQLILDMNQTSFDIYSKGNAESSGIRHATGKLSRDRNANVSKQVSLDECASRCIQEISKSDCYKLFHEMGLEYGACFQGIDRLFCGQGEALGQIKISPALKTEIDDYHLHPTILDACFQVLLGTVCLDGKSAYLPVQIDRIRVYGRPDIQFWSYARLVEQTATHLKGDIQLLDEDGNILVEIQGFRCKALEVVQKSIPEKIDDYLYEYQWKLKARPGQELVSQVSNFLPSPLQITEIIQPEAFRLSEQFNRKHYYEVVELQTDALCTLYILQAFQQLGWQPKLQDRISVVTLAEQLGVASPHWRLLGRMLEILQQDGILSQVGDEWQICQIPVWQEPQESWRKLIAQYGSYLAELTMLGRCGEQLAGVLQGNVDPLTLIFPEGSLTISEHLYQDSPTYRIYNLLVQKALAKVLEQLPTERTVRILEIGAGTGSLTSYVLPLLSANRTEYVFTDVSQLFVTRAEQKFQDYPFVQYQILDIEVDPKAQGFDAHSFDLILASDALHATSNLHQTLENVKHLLASEGLLVLLELTKSTRSIDLVFGLLKGWWLFSDLDLRPKHPLLTWQKWRDLLAEVGFTEVAGILDNSSTDESLHTVILATGPNVREDVQPVEVISSQLEQPGNWLIFADSSAVGEQLAELLKKRQEIPILISPGTVFEKLDAQHFQIRPESLDDMQQLLLAVNGEQALCRGIVHLWSLDVPPPEQFAFLESAQQLGCLSVLHLVQALAKVHGSGSPRLFLVTNGTEAVGGTVTSISSVAQSALWGLGRVIINEHPELQCKMVDLSFSISSEEIQSLFDELWAEDGEDEIALRGQERMGHRLMRVSTTDLIQNQRSKIQNRHQPFRLEISTPGVVDNLTLRAITRQEPNVGEVEIQVCATGLNFKDVAKTMNLLADASLESNFSGRTLGLECAGIITAIGSQVEGFEVGDRVIALAPHSFSTYTIADARLVVHQPQHLSFEEAATVPIVFLTAYYALHYLGRIEKGDCVLIHAAAGGVGLAAIQIAKLKGAEIFATAGSPEKREFLRSLGVKYVMDSRSLAFAEEVMEITKGKGVDIILNSLAGEAIPKSLSILGSYGRFIEIGKRDIDNNSKLGLRPFQNNLSFFAVDLDRLAQERPELSNALFREVMQHFEDRTFHPLPHRVFPISQVVSAFRYMAQAKHIGKIVVSLQDSEVGISPSSEEAVTFRADATYLISGGLGGFGLGVAQWLVQHGARHLVLMGRSGAVAEPANATIKAMQEVGAEVVVAKADVSQSQQVATVLAEIDRFMPPLRGIIHAAMVLDDAPLLELNQERLQTVMAPKMNGAWNLHTQTSNIPLDFFVQFSSISSIVGNPGQANYAAANSFLDALTHHRRAQGLPSLTLNWGALGDIGYVAQNKDVGEYLKQLGIKSLLSQQALNILGELLRIEAIQIGVGNMDWHQFLQVHTIATSPRFSHLASSAAVSENLDAQYSEGDLLHNTLLSVAPQEQLLLLESCLREQVARVLGISPAKLDLKQPLISLGLDSLMAVELSNRIKREIGVNVPTMKIMQGLDIAGLIELISSTSINSAVTPLQPQSVQIDMSNGIKTENSTQVLAKVDDMTDAQVDALLNAMLS